MHLCILLPFECNISLILPLMCSWESECDSVCQVECHTPPPWRRQQAGSAEFYKSSFVMQKHTSHLAASASCCPCSFPSDDSLFFCCMSLSAVAFTALKSTKYARSIFVFVFPVCTLEVFFFFTYECSAVTDGPQTCVFTQPGWREKARVKGWRERGNKINTGREGRRGGEQMDREDGLKTAGRIGMEKNSAKGGGFLTEESYKSLTQRRDGAALSFY